MAANEKIDFRLPKKEKRPHDVFFLENGLQVTIVSDDTADQAAAALDVRVGALCDPVCISYQNTFTFQFNFNFHDFVPILVGNSRNGTFSRTHALPWN